MFNKKVLAVALAAAFTSGAQAVVDLDATESQKITYASEVVTAGADTVEVINNGGLLDLTTTVGFTIGEGTSKYVRIDLANGTFGAAPSITIDTDANYTATLSAGGTADDSFVIYEVSATDGAGDIAPADEVSLSAASYIVSTDSVSSVSYRLYETATGAANKLENTLKFVNTQFTELASAATGELVVANDNEATVASGFTNFSAGSLGATSATIGYLNTDLSFKEAYDLDGTLVTAEDIIDDEQDIVFTGDFSFGEWTLEMDDACNSGSPVAITPTETGGIIEDVEDSTLTAGDWYVCVDVDGEEVIAKGTYDVTLADDMLGGDLGSITYDTTTIEVPYLTTFEDYNQRLILVNNGSAAADYSISFTTETGTEATAGDAATGSIPANSTLVLRSADVVTLDGRTRTSATIEVEGVDANIQAATQTVNLSDGTTDTVVLNANSITSLD
ncbi:hypothetical protein [Alteromonas halophila]|uniref:Uncharacterized protein n=1 Tax=Alteromonas halophila TaxID=516698 RepID=A0A918JPC9_9ALTE|nr:hypothetical protein [Alteromonas halophila]GGW92506.1 hypothetical protein GCM10007391_28610 [Alteromonas halophila]